LVAFVALLGAAGFRAAPGVLMVPLTLKGSITSWLPSGTLALVQQLLA
jgi:hypothetical protein